MPGTREVEGPFRTRGDRGAHSITGLLAQLCQERARACVRGLSHRGLCKAFGAVGVDHGEDRGQCRHSDSLMPQSPS